MSETQLRDILRWTHVIAGGIVGAILYSPLVDNDAALWIARIAVVPFLVGGGLWMWKQSHDWASRRAARVAESRGAE